MTVTSTGDSPSIFKDGKLKPGIYKIQNLYTQTYIDIHEHSRKSVVDLSDDRKWEINPLGAGYSVQRVEPGKPEQYCVPLCGVKDGTKDGTHPNLIVTPYPAAWRLEIADEKEYLGFEYARFYWEMSNMVWDLEGGYFNDGTMVKLFKDEPRGAWRIWKLLPVKVEGVPTPSQLLSEKLGSDSLPSYDVDTTGQSSTHLQHAESEHDELGTTVNEVTVVTTTGTVTTRKRYRVEDI